jgi:hypothetical protein
MRSQIGMLKEPIKRIERSGNAAFGGQHFKDPGRGGTSQGRDFTSAVSWSRQG